jgi:hypothetical protein
MSYWVKKASENFRLWQLMQTAFIVSRFFSQLSSFLETAGRSVQEIRSPGSWVTGRSGVALM